MSAGYESPAARALQAVSMPAARDMPRRVDTGLARYTPDVSVRGTHFNYRMLRGQALYLVAWAEAEHKRVVS